MFYFCLVKYNFYINFCVLYVKILYYFLNFIYFIIIVM